MRNFFIFVSCTILLCFPVCYSAHCGASYQELKDDKKSNIALTEEYSGTEYEFDILEKDDETDGEKELEEIQQGAVDSGIVGDDSGVVEVKGKITYSPNLEKEKSNPWYLGITLADVSRQDAPSIDIQTLRYSSNSTKHKVGKVGEHVGMDDDRSETIQGEHPPTSYSMTVDKKAIQHKHGIYSVSGVLNINWDPFNKENLKEDGTKKRWIDKGDYYTTTQHSVNFTDGKEMVNVDIKLVAI